MRFIIPVIVSILFSVQSAQASDLAREKRLAEQIEELIFDGEVIYALIIGGVSMFIAGITVMFVDDKG